MLSNSINNYSAVNGHLDNPSGRNWVDFDSALLDDFKNLVGAANISEVAVNSTLTTNLHNLLINFYKPSKERYKIITDSMSFPSDFVSIFRLNAYNVLLLIVRFRSTDQVTRS